jgi:hypothetical protein
MIKESRELLVNKLRSDTDLFTLVAGRVYPEDIATLTNPRYPAVTISSNGGIPDEYLSELADTLVTIKCYSFKSYNQGWDVYEKAKAKLAFEVFENSSVRIRCTENSLPTERFDTIGGIYIISSSWAVYVIGV